MIPGVRRFSVLLLSQLSSHFHYDQFDAIYGLHGTMIINLCPLGLKFKQALIHITYIESLPSTTLVPSTQKCTLVYTAALNFIFIIAKHLPFLRLYPHICEEVNQKQCCYQTLCTCPRMLPNHHAFL